MTHATYLYLSACGSARGWSYADQSRIASLVLPAMAELATQGGLGLQSLRQVQEFCRSYIALCAVSADPFYGCGQACPGATATCLYRHDAALVVASRNFDDDYRQAGWDRERLVDLSVRGVNRLLAPTVPLEAKRSVALCLLIQKIDSDGQLSPVARQNLVDDMIETYRDRQTGRADRDAMSEAEAPRE